MWASERVAMNRHTEAQETALLEELRDIVAPDDLRQVKELYEDDGRYYHTWDHALDVIAAVTRLPLPQGEKRQAHLLAALFHDVIYTPGAKDNEARSANVLEEMCPGSSLANELIMATVTHADATRDNTEPYTWDFLDCDILIIAEPCWPLAVQVDWNVRAELIGAYGEKAVQAGRGDFLRNWLTKPSVFLGQFYGTTNEWQARMNILRLANYSRHDFSELAK